MTPNTTKQLAAALAAIARQFEMESYAKGDKSIHGTLETVEAAAEAVAEDVGKEHPESDRELLEKFAFAATDEDINSILKGNIAAFEKGETVHDRVSARWEFAKRVISNRPKS